MPKAKFEAKDFVARFEDDTVKKDELDRERPLLALRRVLVKEGEDKAVEEGKWIEKAVGAQEQALYMSRTRYIRADASEAEDAG